VQDVATGTFERPADGQSLPTIVGRDEQAFFFEAELKRLARYRKALALFVGEPLSLGDGRVRFKVKIGAVDPADPPPMRLPLFPLEWTRTDGPQGPPARRWGIFGLVAVR
jgi:hypothetical protein